MTTKKTVSHSHAHSTTDSVEAAVAVPAVPSTISAAPAPTITQATVTGPTPPPISLAYLTPPPASANIPAVPSNFVPESGTTYRAVVPKKAELVALPLAVADLQKFTNYTQVVGSTAPPYEEILQTFNVTNAWSSMRTSSSAWDVYSRDQEGICWGVMRPSMESLKAAFDLAATRDPSLPAKLPGLATLLGVKAAIAVRAASTKRANKKAVAEGKAPIHGQVGKARKRATDKAIVAAATAATGGANVQSASAPSAVAPSAPVQAAAPAQAPAPVVVPVQVASAAPPAPAASGLGAAVAPVAPPPSGNGVATAVNGTGH
jgi:hypothetical protein